LTGGLLYFGKVSKYNYGAPKSQLDWLNLPHSPTLPPPVTVNHRASGQIPDEPEQGTDDYGEKDFEEMREER